MAEAGAAVFGAASAWEVPLANLAGGGSCVVPEGEAVKPPLGTLFGELMPLLCSLDVEDSEELSEGRFPGLLSFAFSSCTNDFLGPPSPPSIIRSAPRSSRSSTARSPSGISKAYARSTRR